jgi:hypothetical protein
VIHWQRSILMGTALKEKEGKYYIADSNFPVSSGTKQLCDNFVVTCERGGGGVGGAIKVRSASKRCIRQNTSSSSSCWAIATIRTTAEETFIMAIVAAAVKTQSAILQTLNNRLMHLVLR